jgi:hypothetical protein
MASTTKTQSKKRVARKKLKLTRTMLKDLGPRDAKDPKGGSVYCGRTR